jgi:hypothetical protein
MRKILVLTMAVLALLSVDMAVPAQAATPTLTATSVSFDPRYIGDSPYYFFVDASAGWVPACDVSTLAVGTADTVLTPGSGITGHYFYPGTDNAGDRYAEVDFDVADPAFDVSQVDSVAIQCTAKWRTFSYLSRAYYAANSKAGVRSSSRSWSPYSIGGSCNYSGLNGELLVTCLWAKSVVRYTLSSPRRTAIVGSGVSLSPGLFPCHSSVQKKLVTRRSIRFTVTTANASGFAQCSINSVRIKYKGFKRVKVSTIRSATGAWARWEAGVSAATTAVNDGREPSLPAPYLRRRAGI